jgi:hypothetical protein
VIPDVNAETPVLSSARQDADAIGSLSLLFSCMLDSGMDINLCL